MKQKEIHTLGEYRFIIKPVHKDEIKAGDTILLDGELKTVCGNDIRKGFCGTTIHGESFKLGLEQVKRVHFVQKNGLPSSGFGFSVVKCFILDSTSTDNRYY